MHGAYRKARFSGKMVDGKVTKSRKSGIIKPIIINFICQFVLQHAFAFPVSHATNE